MRHRDAAMEVITRVITEEEAGSTVRHILRAKLHFSSPPPPPLPRGETGLLVTGAPAPPPCISTPGTSWR